MQTVALFKARCLCCFWSHVCPHFSDFDCGSLLFTGEQGNVWAGFYVPGNAVWELVDSVLGEGGKSAPEERGDIVADVCASLADPVEGQRLYAHAVCPHCRRNTLRVNDRRRIGTSLIPVVSFGGFLALSKAEQRRTVLEFPGRR